MDYDYDPQMQQRKGCNPNMIRLAIPLAIAAFSYCQYATKVQVNPVTGEKQNVDLTVDQEIALGLNSAPQMAGEFGGLDSSERDQRIVDEIGNVIVQRSDASRSPYQFNFHLLADNRTVNAFALPGGQIFITRALFDRLKTPGQLAGVLGHEIGHVIGRHGAEHLAKQKLTAGLVSAAVIGIGDGSGAGGSIAQMIGSMVNMKHGRKDELESDALGAKYMVAAGYHPESLIQVMEILKQASGGGNQPEFASTHPNPENRKAMISQNIKKMFPNGVPTNLVR
jgi:beta-barrel assembly-enhancing protease